MKSILRQIGIPAVSVGLSLIGFVSPGVSQIPVIGGRLTGQAGFFVPNSGNTSFFDLGTRTLRLVTPNGVTVDSRFSPTFGQIEPIGNRLPTTGDRGILQGSLSGRAFDISGSPIFFSNTQTQLNFTINSFSPPGTLAGTLLAPTNSNASTKIFVPVLGVSLDAASAQSFTPIPGVLAVGAFDANLPSGAIALPNNLRFGTPLVSEFAVPDTVISTSKNFSFQLEGIGIPNAPGTLGEPLGSFFDPFFVGGVRFSSGNATTNFFLQLDGTPLTITGSGNFATIIEIKGITPASSSGTPLLPGAIRYSVIGNGGGSATNFDPLRFNSANSTNTFLFQDSVGNKVQGISAGPTNFVIAGAASFTTSSFSGLTANSNFNAIGLGNVGSFVPAAVITPPSLVAGSSQTSTGQTSTGQTGGSTSTTNPVTIVLPPTANFSLPRIYQVSGTGTIPFITMTNPSLPDSSVFPNINSIQVPIVSSGQNLTRQDTINLATGGINQIMGELTQSMPIESPPAPSSPLARSSSITTDNNLNFDPTTVAASDSSPMMEWVNSFGATLSNQLRQAGENPIEFSRQQEALNQPLEALTNSMIYQSNVSQSINKREADSKERLAKGDAAHDAWRVEQGMSP